jgi:hypothetical protein
MTTIEGDIVIRRPVDVVFDYVADQRNEPQYNRRMLRAEKITGGPVREGTVFRSAVASLGYPLNMRIECIGYQRPERYSSTTTMRQADFDVTLTFEPVPDGTRMHWSEELRPKGVYRLLGPTFVRRGQRQEEQIWSSMKRRLESGD